MSEEAARVERIGPDGEVTVRESNVGVEWLDAMVKARGEFKGVAKSGYNPFDKYDYPTLQDFIDAVDASLIKHGLLLVCEQVAVAYFTSPSEKMPNGARVRMRGELFHAPTGQVKVAYQTAHAFDKGDKAEFKASTGARKYLLANLLHIHTNDDPEKDSVPEGDSTNRSTQRRATKQETAQAATDGAKKKLTREDIVDRINACQTAKGLAEFLTERVGKIPVARYPDDWKVFGKAAADRVAAAKWPDEQKALVDAVLAGVREQLLDLKAKAAPAQEVASRTAGVPTEAMVKAWSDGQLTPGDLHMLVKQLAEDTPRGLAVRQDPKLWLTFVSHAYELVFERMEAGDWPQADCEPVGTMLAELKDRADLEVQKQETFGGSNSDAKSNA